MNNKHLTVIFSIALCLMFILSIFIFSNSTNLKPAGSNDYFEPVDFDLMDYIYVENLPSYTWEFPVKGFIDRGISAEYGWRIHPIYGTTKLHPGIDIMGIPGEEVYAMSAGTVTRAGWFGGYGLCIIIEHENDIKTLYGHLMRGSINVNVGDIVSTGQFIGNIGSTGIATGPHLHFEVRIDNKSVDPINYLERIRGGN